MERITSIGDVRAVHVFPFHDLESGKFPPEIYVLDVYGHTSPAAKSESYLPLILEIRRNGEHMRQKSRVVEQE